MNWLTTLGLLAATCTTTSFLPQAIKVIKTRHTKDLSLGMYALLSIGLCLWFAYGILVNDLPLMMANGITLIFTVIILFLKIKYK
ncbi:MAG: SemiSWEET transporter [Candidatus Schekmanbacteria bacterium]|nr:SemiSWEET transporter [Candidatus Schekmanbacteria bacterium]